MTAILERVVVLVPRQIRNSPRFSADGSPASATEFPPPTPVISSDQGDGYQFRIIDSVEYAHAQKKCASLGEVAPIVDHDLLKERYRAEAEKKQNEIGGSLPDQVVVGVIDSGLGQVGDNFFKTQFFSINQPEAAGLTNKDDDFNKFIDDIYGINISSRNGLIAPYPGPGTRAHGTMMASLILGGPKLANQWLYSDANAIIKLKVVNFSSKVPDTIEDASKLPEAIDYLAGKGALIINMSLANWQNLKLLHDTVNDHADILFVAAAGNAKQGPGVNLTFNEFFPARYGGTAGANKRNVLTVAAHDLNGKLAPFSNYSSLYVDLSAPGCAVEARDDQGRIALDDGTSPATAVTSFAAALTASLGLRDAQRLKNRLVASTDYQAQSENELASAGKLDIIKSISLRTDVMRLNNGKYVFGKIGEVADLNRFCDDDIKRINLNNVRRIVPNITGSSQLQIDYLVEVGGGLEKVRCTQAATYDSIGLVDGIAGPSIAEIADITLATFSRN